MNMNRIDTSALVLRIALGSVLTAHGLLKFLVFTLPGAAGFFATVGFPGWTAYVVAPLEVIAGIALIVGWHSSVAALAALPVLLGASIVHAGNGWLFSNPNGGWEYPVVLALLGLGVTLLGDGRYSVRSWRTSRA